MCISYFHSNYLSSKHLFLLKYFFCHHQIILFLYICIRSTAWHSSKVSRKEERWGRRWILGNVDHSSKHALEMKMVLDGSHAFEWILGTHSDSTWGFLRKKKNTFVSSSTYTTLNNASDAAENTFILTVCLRITGIEFSTEKKRENLMDCWMTKWANVNVVQYGHLE